MTQLIYMTETTMKETLESLLQLQTLDQAPAGHAGPAQIEATRKRIPEAVLGHYDRLRARGRKPVATASPKGVCGGCHMAVSRGQLAALQRGEAVQICEHCGRCLVYLPALETQRA